MFFQIFLCLIGVHRAKLAENSGTEQQGKSAIIAIEIVDPSKKTDSKNVKRTIESSLGYGYQNNVHSQPKFQIYKYSQHDIPPYQGPTNYQNDNGKNTGRKVFRKWCYGKLHFWENVFVLKCRNQK